mmetsp:Transcript_4553/g.14949  ORF Transcript_4553/g.14949 Transcript_4553/m.14949 type:complete len:362 (+) Transcript_4553:227-1312(+)
MPKKLDRSGMPPPIPPTRLPPAGPVRGRPPPPPMPPIMLRNISGSIPMPPPSPPDRPIPGMPPPKPPAADARPPPVPPPPKPPAAPLGCGCWRARASWTTSGSTRNVRCSTEPGSVAMMSAIRAPPRSDRPLTLSTRSPTRSRPCSAATPPSTSLRTTLSASTLMPRGAPAASLGTRTSIAWPSSPLTRATLSVCVFRATLSASAARPDGGSADPSTSYTTSPTRRPAASAAPPRDTSSTSFPRDSLSPSPPAEGPFKRTVCSLSGGGAWPPSPPPPPNGTLSPPGPVWNCEKKEPAPPSPPPPKGSPPPKNCLKISRGSTFIVCVAPCAPPGPLGPAPPLMPSSPNWSYTLRCSSSESTV